MRAGPVGIARQGLTPRGGPRALPSVAAQVALEVDQPGVLPTQGFHVRLVAHLVEPPVHHGVLLAHLLLELLPRDLVVADLPSRDAPEGLGDLGHGPLVPGDLHLPPDPFVGMLEGHRGEGPDAPDGPPPAPRPKASAISGMVRSSPAISTSRPIHSSGCSEAIAAKAPTSSTATCWNGLPGSSGWGSVPPRIGSRIISQFCMKKTGLRAVWGRPSHRTCSSTSHLLSKWPMPVRRWALPTEL